jgi:hypothetical protein
VVDDAEAYQTARTDFADTGSADKLINVLFEVSDCERFKPPSCSEPPEGLQ